MELPLNGARPQTLLLRLELLLVLQIRAQARQVLLYTLLLHDLLALLELNRTWLDDDGTAVVLVDERVLRGIRGRLV